MKTGPESAGSTGAGSDTFLLLLLHSVSEAALPAQVLPQASDGDVGTDIFGASWVREAQGRAGTPW